MTVAQTLLLDILIGVIATLLGSALIGVWSFRGRIWPRLASLRMPIYQNITVPISLCIEILQKLARLTAQLSRSRYSAVFKFQVSISRSTWERSSVEAQSAPTPPKLEFNDAYVLHTFPATYSELVAECRKRYSDFKLNFRFYNLLESLKSDPQCAHERRLNPSSEKSPTQMFYNLDAVLARLDDEYTKLL